MRPAPPAAHGVWGDGVYTCPAMKSAGPPAEGADGRILAKLFIAGWLAAQLAYPFVTKFDLQPFRYRWAPLSWGMYANPDAEYQVAMYRLSPEGEPSEIVFDADVARGTGWSRGLVQGETSAIRRLETLREVEIVLRRVARRNRDGAVYVGNVYWYYLDEGRAVEQEIRVRAPR